MMEDYLGIQSMKSMKNMIATVKPEMTEHKKYSELALISKHDVQLPGSKPQAPRRRF